MTTLIAPAADVPLAIAFGLTGLSAQMVWPLFRRRQTMLTVQLGAACSYATSYALMGRETATAVCLIGACQTAVALLAGGRPWLSRTGYLFLPVVVAAGALTYAGLPTVLAVIACCLVMVGRLQRDLLRMRAIQLTASPFGISHDLAVGAWPCLAGAVLSFAIAFGAFRRAKVGLRAAAAAA